ncbi:PucR family transcriptional regulator ligand-binding domain-containing protein [Bacillus spongiae]|uniref:PucR family transcriptional regulator ligand-binding domain-containing protein n=1 Tax=Bacillus spongiae TaxID=2683610 RepID=A0ABU8HGD1_9BACI
MRKDFHLTVQQVLKRKYFQSAKVLAGSTSLHRHVKWVHIVEVTTIENLLNGNELILTTGLAWKEEHTFLSIMDQLIASRAAGICLELGTNIESIPPSVIKKANKHDLPLIIFQEEVPFVKITQDIHTTIINQQYSLIRDLENYSQRLNKYLLTISDVKEILQFLYDYIETPILFKYKDEKVISFPPRKKRDGETHVSELYHSNYISTKVIVFDEEFAELRLVGDPDIFQEFEHLLLDRTATAMAHYFLRELFFEEKKRMEEAKWVEGLLSGSHSPGKIHDYLRKLKVTVPIHGGVVCLCTIHSYEEKEKMDGTYFQLLTRTTFEQYGFVAITESKDNQPLYILLDTRSPSTWKRRIIQAIERINDSHFVRKNTSSSLFFSVGKYTHQLSAIHKSYQSSLEAIRLQPLQNGNGKYVFFDDLHLIRMVAILEQQMDLSQLVNEYLQPIIDYDQKQNTKLFQTLKVYLHCHGCKKKTAEQLYIVRQTLYHRLSRIKKLLGDDYMEPRKRMTLELLLFAYDYFQEESSLPSQLES